MGRGSVPEVCQMLEIAREIAREQNGNSSLHPTADEILVR